MASTWEVVGFDLETASADQMFTGGHEGPFVRLCGAIDHHTGETRLFTDTDEFISVLAAAKTIYGHNIISFDLVALAHHHGIDYMAFCRKAVDTILISRQRNPVPTKTQRGDPRFARQHQLDTLAKQLGHEGKTDDVAALAAKWGGFDKIPVDDEDFRNYLIGDLHASRALAQHYIAQVDDYVRREHGVVPLQNLMTLNGWRIDLDLLDWRVRGEDKAVLEAGRWLSEHYGMPLGREVGCLVPNPDKPGKKMRSTRWISHGSPHRTTEGIAALEAAFHSLGVLPPRTEKGALSTSSDALGDGWVMVGRSRQPGMLRKYPGNEALRELCEKITVVSGKARKYQEVKDYLVGDRVHASVGGVQASGRWAMVKPSVTNIGKRGEKNLAQREIFIADEGEVLMAFDLDQVDMRAVAALSGDLKYQELFAPGMDAHTENAKTFFGDPGRRGDAKAIGHGVNYGRGSKAIAEAHGLDFNEVDGAILAMWRKYKRLAAWRKEMDAKGQKGFLDNGFGRRMRPDPKHSYTQSPALMGQGATRDIMCEGLLHLPEWTWPMLRGVIHDEVVLSVPVGKVDAVKEAVAKAFTMDFLGVSITCGSSEPAKNWRECY